jgi:hypothetical protein
VTVEPGQVRLKPRRSIFSSYDGRGSSIGITPSLGTGTASFSYAFRNDDTGKGCWTGEIQGNRVTLTIKK